VGEYALSARLNRNQTTGFRIARVLEQDVAAPVKVAVAQEQAVVANGSGASASPGANANRDANARPGVNAKPGVNPDPNASSTSPVPGGPGRKFRDCSHCPDMIVVPAGSFIMGAPPANHTWDTRDLPAHRVTIGREFAVGIYDVTRAQYSLFVHETHRSDGKGCDVIDPAGRWITDPNRTWHDPAFPQTELDPVVCVSWEDAKAYVYWLNAQIEQQPAAGNPGTGPYRLPTETEWEYAARAGSSTPFYWGSEASHDYANYGLEQCFPCGATVQGKDRWYYTSPVASFAPNAFGLYDTLGNVWQWTEDCMHYGYAGAPEDGSVWRGGECKLRVIRGGSWLDPAKFVVVTTRNPWGPGSRNQANGFRVVRSLD
jgi:formylglycine-generating enzyme required for sulfatase activity